MPSTPNTSLEEPTASERAREKITAADRDAAIAWAWEHVETPEGWDTASTLKGEWLTGLMNAFARHRRAFTQPTPPVSGDVREAIARIIAPMSFSGDVGSSVWNGREVSRRYAFAKADAILAAFATQERAIPEASGVEAVREATNLATALWERHWRDDAPDWKPLNTLSGVLSQIDNMTASLVRALTLPDAGDAA